MQWLRNDKVAMNLTNGRVVALTTRTEVNFDTDGTRHETRRNCVHTAPAGDLCGPVRFCDTGEIVAWVKAHVGDGQKELEP